jgi:hypothetical protein
MANQNCAHASCNCKVEPGKGVSRGSETYCSNYCANTGTSGSGKCQCGHPDCR